MCIRVAAACACCGNSYHLDRSAGGYGSESMVGCNGGGKCRGQGKSAENGGCEGGCGDGWNGCMLEIPVPVHIVLQRRSIQSIEASTEATQRARLDAVTLGSGLVNLLTIENITMVDRNPIRRIPATLK